MSKLFQSNTERAAYTVVYNLVPFDKTIILPVAYVVSFDKKGELNYIRKLATDKTIGGYGLKLDATRKVLFESIEKLQTKELEKKFSPPKKTPKPLKTLLEDKLLKQQITKYIDRILGQFIDLVSEDKLPLVWNMERKDSVQEILIQHTGESFQPLFYFKKQEDGILYRLRIQKGEEIWTIKEHDITPLTRFPGWFIGDFGLYKLEKVSGFFLLPFCFKNENLIIPSLLKTYFKRVILPVVAKTEIEAEGFDIISQGDLKTCRLEAVPDYNQKNWALSIQFIYPKITFGWSDARQQSSTLEFNEADQPVLFKTVRNKEKEAEYLSKIKNYGLENRLGAYFSFPLSEEADEFQLFAWLAEKQTELEAAGFQVSKTQIGDKTIALAAPKLSLESTKQRDWFDIHGSIEVGEFHIPFPRIFPYIRDKNRFYPLPNATFFVIPNEWMTKYAGIAQFAQIKGNKALLTKSQYSLLQEAGIAEKIQEILDSRVEEVDFQVSSKLKATLRTYQLEGAKWLFRHYQDGLGACLADDMGLGKTLQTITILLHAKENKPTIETAEKAPQLGLFQSDTDFLNPLKALIILPSSLVFNWAAEITKFAPSLSFHKYIGAKRQKDTKVLSRFDVVLTTYQTALRDKEILKNVNWEYIVLDESQQIKNKNSKIFKAINELESAHKLSLSGTPIENSLSDLWAQMEFINSGHLGTYAFFQREFMLPIQKGQNEEKKERLRNLVQPFLLRRTKDLVAKDLPPLTEQVFYCEMTTAQKKLYESEKSAVRNHLLESYNNSNIQYHSTVIQSLMKLRQLANHPKLVKSHTGAEGSGKFTDVLERIEVIHKGGHKVLVFSSFVKHLALFQEEFDKKKMPYVTLTGDMTAKKRQASIDSFESNDTIQTFFISLKAGGTGLNLTSAEYVFILDPWWNPFAEQQAIARAHRIGQTKQVIATKFITRDSIEEKILKLQDEKRQLADDIMSGAGSKAFTREEIGYLFE